MNAAYGIATTSNEFDAAREHYRYLVESFQSPETGRLEHGAVEEWLHREGLTVAVNSTVGVEAQTPHATQCRGNWAIREKAHGVPPEVLLATDAAPIVTGVGPADAGRAVIEQALVGIDRKGQLAAGGPDESHGGPPRAVHAPESPHQPREGEQGQTEDTTDGSRLEGKSGARHGGERGVGACCGPLRTMIDINFPPSRRRTL